MEEWKDQASGRPEAGMFWRTGWDSSPRYGETVLLSSSQVHSTTRPPVRDHTAILVACRVAHVSTNGTLLSGAHGQSDASSHSPIRAAIRSRPSVPPRARFAGRGQRRG